MLRNLSIVIGLYNKAMLFARGLAVLSFAVIALAQGPPKAGPVTIMKSSEIKAGMKAVAWTVFEGSTPEAVPIEIIGPWRNAWGPKQDIILGKMGGKAARTNVAGGMSGSPVYVDGKLIGAVALRLSVFSPDAICGITPIELMLEINDFDKTVPVEAKTPEKVKAVAQTGPLPGELAARVFGGGGLSNDMPMMVPIETPLMFSGFSEETLRHFAGVFQQLGIKPVFGGAAGSVYETKPAANWKSALQPGQAVAGVLVNGDLSITGLGTVSYNDGKRVLAFGHPFFNLGPVEMPMSQGEILTVLASAFQPNKVGNATEIVGALKQDRHSGIMGVLGEQAKMIPVSVKLRNHAGAGKGVVEKNLRYNVFEHQKWTPTLMMITAFNSINGVNDYSEEVTYKMNARLEFDGGLPPMMVQTMQAPGEGPLPAPVLLAGHWGERINRLFSNPIAMPKVKSAEVVVDLLPERRIAQIESGWLSQSEAAPGDTVTIKAFLRPFRGARFERELKLKIPEGMPKGEHRIVLSDGDHLNNSQRQMAGMNRFLDLRDTVSLINQERSNTTLYASLLQQRPTVYSDDKTMPNLPQTVINVMQTGRTSNRNLSTSAETVMAQASSPFEVIVQGNHSLKIVVR